MISFTFFLFLKDEDEALSPEELQVSLSNPAGCHSSHSHTVNKKSSQLYICLFQELFAICPTMPWGEDVLSSVETNNNGWITLQGFLAQWT